MFLKNAIERILADRDIKRKENAGLKKACESALEQLQAEVEAYAKKIPNQTDILPNYQTYILADAYFLPFELACLSNTPRIVNIALDSLQKLIAYGHLVGDCPDPQNPQRLLIDRIVEAICFPFKGPHTDDGVQLQIIKAILAVILSNTCKVHDASLLLAVRTCFNIYLASKSPINQSTAKGILTQTINTVFINMERIEDEGQNIEVDWEEMIIKNVVDSIVNQVVSTEMHGNEKEVQSKSDDTVSIRSSSHAPSPMLNGTLGDSVDSSDELSNHRLEFKTAEEKDAFLIFRSLCKLAMKELPENPDPKSHELRSKVLSLEMILMVVQNFNAPLSDKHSFIYAIRTFLCVALTKNAASKIIDIFEKAMAIFVLLVNKFKVYLKKQIEVFFNQIIISTLESSSLPFEYRWVVLNTISKISDNSQSVMDIYVNYDCHLTSANIFENLVTYLSKIAMGYSAENSPNATPIMKERERKMKELGLECLVKILQCMVTWYEEVACGRSGDLSTGDFEDNSSTHGSYADSASTLQQYEQVKQQKGIIEHGIDLFARKPKQGLSFLQDKGIVGKEPEDIASFFFTEERLDKAVVGDYLGDGEEFNKKVMYSYIDHFDFSDLTIVKALRTLLDKFRLPGEAQKIDRLMEKFASRYCECNPNLKLFASADTAYVLSYSIIMLTTDLHSPQVKNKMTKEQYITMNRGINDQNDLPDEFLKEIYDDIAANEIKMKPGATKRPKLNAANVTYKQKKAFQNFELETISQTAHALMQAASHAQQEFTSASHYEHIRPMFMIAWSPCLAVFSIGLQSSDDPEIWRRCLEGFRCGIRVACVFHMDTQRDAYLQALTQFTLLTAKKALSEMKSKNVDSIKLLITIGVENGNYLEECWYDVLKCISQLELAQHIGSWANGTIKQVFHIDERHLLNIQERLGETASQSVILAVDKIFTGSNRLSGEAIVHFVRALCRVSLEELSLPGAPRMFMLQKIVEISFYNMSRIRIEWSKIWHVLGEHFNAAGCNTNTNISHFALDALRQLSMKFLEKGELPNFRFQKEFLRPFEVIMMRNKALECREMIIACITHMVKSHGDKIRSGWKNIFSLFMMAATEYREEVVEKAFEITSYIITDVFPHYFLEVFESFQELVKCLSEFACNGHFQDISMEAIRLIREVAKLVDKNADVIKNHIPDDDHGPSNIHETQIVWIRGWFPILFELSCIINRCTLDVRTRGLAVMFEIMKTYGESFRTEWWNELFKVVFRIFDFMKIGELGKEKSEWMVTTCNHALLSLIDVFTHYYTNLSHLLPNIYEQIYGCVQNGNEQLAKSAIGSIETLVWPNADRFHDEQWEYTVEFFEKIFEASTPEFTIENPDSISRNTSNANLQNGEAGSESNLTETSSISIFSQDDSLLTSSITKCIIQLEAICSLNNMLFGKDAFKIEGPKQQKSPSLQINGHRDSIETTENICAYRYMSCSHLMRLVECLLKSHNIATHFNTNDAQRHLLWKATFKGKSKPNLFKQETNSLHCALNVLFRLYGQVVDENEATKYRERIVRIVSGAIDYYLSIHSENHRNAWFSVIQLLLNRTYELPEQRFKQLGHEYLSLLPRLIKSEEPQIIRDALSQVIRRAFDVSLNL